MADPASYKAEKVASTIAGLAVAGSALGIVAIRIVLPMLGIHVPDLAGINLSYLVYGLGGAGALAGGAIAIASFDRIKEADHEKMNYIKEKILPSATITTSVDHARAEAKGHAKKNLALFFGAATLIGLPFAIYYANKTPLCVGKPINI